MVYSFLSFPDSPTPSPLVVFCLPPLLYSVIFSNSEIPVTSSLETSICKPFQTENNMSIESSLHTQSSQLPTSNDFLPVNSSEVKSQFPVSTYTEFYPGSSFHASLPGTLTCQSNPVISSMSQVPMSASFTSFQNPPVISASFVQPSHVQSPDITP